FGRLVESEDHDSESPLHLGGGAAIVVSDSTIASVPRCWSLGSLPRALPAPTQELRAHTVGAGPRSPMDQWPSWTLRVVLNRRGWSPRCSTPRRVHTSASSGIRWTRHSEPSWNRATSLVRGSRAR